MGGILSIISDLTFLAAAQYWRQPVWPVRPAASTVAAWRTVEGIQVLTQWPEAFGFAVLACGLVALGRLCGKHRIFPAARAAQAYLHRRAMGVVHGRLVVSTTSTSRGLQPQAIAHAGRTQEQRRSDAARLVT